MIGMSRLCRIFLEAHHGEIGDRESSKLRQATSWQIAGGYRNGCTIPFRENLQEISKDIQDGFQALHLVCG
jgi:hypothetical protein